MASTASTTVVLPAKIPLQLRDAAEPEELEEHLGQAERNYAARNPASKAAHEEALTVMPGGNTRSVLYSRPFPICMNRGVGNQLFDLDGHQYLDMLGEMTAGVYGHSHEIIRHALISTFDNVGVNIGAHTRGEVKLASLLCERFPCIEQLRFCNSGTEANLYALAIARRVTGKRKVIAFRGGYHGGVIGFAHGVGENNVDPQDWVLGTYNDEEALRDLFEANCDDVAAVIVEGMQGSGGCLPASLSFLQKIQSYASTHGIVFILDEVMTSRLHPSGLQGKYGLRPDLTTLGKTIGGGLSIGAFGGRKDFLETCDPRQSTALPHSGTFNNNTLAMEAGYAGLSKIYTPEATIALNGLGDSLRMKLQAVTKATKIVVTGIGAVLSFHFMDNGVVPSCERDIEQHAIPMLRRLLWFWCIERGYWIAERGMLSLVMGTRMSDVDSFVVVVEHFIATHKSLLQLE
ncbi:hypothetical protein UA08_04899 [Talaromyces atroroseus]|uniref:Aminotransferase n=1 Tax=Talaromyces atroroseus TaxID=1441469 RepID=A0A225AL83_TALAT|nr:hypothetical protein UA08_04899 [Talaromyces atroroseus]OKL60163.1 hypothetical protein UA08_04899 [Talaromyces atroroseus]